MGPGVDFIINDDEDNPVALPGMPLPPVGATVVLDGLPYTVDHVTIWHTTAPAACTHAVAWLTTHSELA